MSSARRQPATTGEPSSIEARLFLAVRPPPEVIGAIGALPRTPEADIRWSDPADLHLTLRFLGPVGVDEVTAAIDRLQPLPVAEVRLDPVVERLGRAVVIPAHGLEALAGEVRRATATLGRPDDRPFVGHLTIGRLRGDRSDGVVLAQPPAATFEVRSLELLSSRPVDQGHRYHLVRAWPLTG